MALGVTMQLPVDDRHTYTREYILGSIAVALGGRAAEEIFLNHMTTGAGSDLVKSTDMARRMVCEYGMSDALGPVTFGHKGEQIFLGRDFQQIKEISEDTSMRIDREVQNIVNEQYKFSRHILEENRPVLVAMAEALLEREVLDGEQIAILVRGETLPPLAGKPAPEKEASTPTGTTTHDQQPEKDKGNHAPLSGPVEQPG
jgi:cell division protease FtsH